jgi:uncharacterized protein (DUF305 family)
LPRAQALPLRSGRVVAAFNHAQVAPDVEQARTGQDEKRRKGDVTMHMYARFGAMVGTSTIVMLGLMYLNTYQLHHVFFSETRTYMALVMGATMAVIMLAFMQNMLSNRRVNIGIFVGSAVLFAVALWLVRSQTTVDEVSYMKAMIPHHSIAILTSERARITDPRVRRLADQIIESQRREILEMKTLIQDLEDRR